MKSLMLLWQESLNELGDWCCTSTSLDLKKAQARSKHEGLSFLTITLPNFAADFQKSLELGMVDRSYFQGFAFKGGLPLFLGGFLDLVFDRGTGLLLSEPDITAIFAIRQLSLMFSKVEIECTERRTRKAIEGFLQTEQDIRVAYEDLEDASKKRFIRISSLLFSGVLYPLQRKLESGESLIPKHGPGATADGLRGNAKFRQVEWTSRLERVFPMVDALLPSPSYWRELEEVHVLDPHQERAVKLTPVAKTLKTPRLIAIEPTCMQYAQQAFCFELVEALGNCYYLGNLIGFDDQLPNQWLAKEGSVTKELATLDLSEASDRVSNQHVRMLLQGFPALAEFVDACRSRKVDVPGFGVKRLAKFASMGSALTFPIEAMVFLTVVFAGIEKELARPLTWRDVESLSSKVRIYGDDIIVPTRFVRTVVSELSTFGYKVNASKSFWDGSFRESCGKEYFEGHDVSIVKARQVLPTQRQDVKEIISAVSLRNQFYWLGMWRSAKWLDDQLQPLLRLPKVSPNSPLLGRNTVLQLSADAGCVDLHVPIAKGWQVSSKLPVNRLADHGALLKWFIKRGNEPFADIDHLERSGRPTRVDIKRRWASTL